MKDYLEIFNDSYEIVLGQSSDRERFFSDFYIDFLNRSDDISSKFADTDLDAQAKMLKKSLFYMVNFFVNKKSSDYLEEIAHLHSATRRDINPLLYDDWIESLMHTVATHHPHFNADIDLAWRIVMAPGIAFMRYHYEQK